MCGGFTCSKNALTTLNILYIAVAFTLIGVAVYGRAASIVTNLPIIGGILACGILLILISILGLVGAVKHHQVMLFFYMVILFMLFLIQFSIACACLAVNDDQQELLAKHGWATVDDTIKSEVQDAYSCCGFHDRNVVNTTMKHPSCEAVDKICCGGDLIDQSCECPPCMEKLKNAIHAVFKLCGGIGLFFSFTELLAIWLARRYRNQPDPDYQPTHTLFVRKYDY